MNCIVKINGREAVPVRAIPFVTGWELSPDVVANGLACTDFHGRLKELHAHHLAHDGAYAEMLPKEWDGVIADLQTLSDALMADETVERASYPLWRKQSPAKLPSHCFVWKDEFERAAICAMNALISLDEERPGDKALNFTPRIPPELVDTIFEGMPKTEEAAVGSGTTWPWGSHETELLKKLAEAGGKFWSLYDPDDSTTAPINEDVEAWLKEQGVAERTAKAMATILRADNLPAGRRKG